MHPALSLCVFPVQQIHSLRQSIWIPSNVSINSFLSSFLDGKFLVRSLFAYWPRPYFTLIISIILISFMFGQSIVVIITIWGSTAVNTLYTR